ncbi:MAG TPA: riboflavin synthase [Fimbriimonas sp.]
MFTGIVQATGCVVSLVDGVLSLRPPSDFAPEGTVVGESIAVNGCCLTVVPSEDGLLRFDLSPETLHRTSLGDVEAGSRVNLERAMSANGMLGGHIVQGHVDAPGEVVSLTPRENAVIVRFRAPREYDRYLIDKGSVTVDGISLTVVDPKDGEFDTWIIPHTLEVTNLGERKPGDRVNLEFDVLAKYVEKLLSARMQASD